MSSKKSSLPSEVVDIIVTTIKNLGLKTVYYAGNADRGLIEALSNEVGNNHVSIMDFTGSWPCIWDPEEFPPGTEDQLRPDWMKGIETWIEGGPMYSDLWIGEVSRPSGWGNPNSYYLERHKVYAFIGESKDIERLPTFDWKESGDVLFATRN